MNPYLKWSLILVGILAVFFLTTGAIHGVLEDRIAENALDSDDELDISKILPEANTLKAIGDIELEEEGPIKEVYQAYDGDDLKGYVIKVDSQGAYSIITIAVAINVEENISGIEVLAQKETEGLGDDIVEDEFTDRFSSKTTEQPLDLVEDDTGADNEIQGITGATISAQAVVTGVNDAVEFYNSQLKGSE